MKTISSAEFRKTYPRLEESTTVTVNGHVLGTWVPERLMLLNALATARDSGLTDRDIAETRPELAKALTAQQKRDAILRRINTKER